MTWAESSAKLPAKEESKETMKARIESKSWCGSYAVASSKFGPAVVGAKSLKTAALKVGQAISVAPIPTRPCCTLPFQCMPCPCLSMCQQQVVQSPEPLKAKVVEPLEPLKASEHPRNNMVVLAGQGPRMGTHTGRSGRPLWGL